MMQLDEAQAIGPMRYRFIHPHMRRLAEIGGIDLNAPPAAKPQTPLCSQAVSEPIKEPDAVDVSRKAAWMQVMFKKHHSIHVPVTECVTLYVASVRGGAHALNDSLTCTRLAQLHQGRQAEAGLPIPDFGSALKFVRQQLTPQNK